MHFAKNIKALRVPGQDVINIICSPVFAFLLCSFFMCEDSTVASDFLDSV